LYKVHLFFKIIKDSGMFKQIVMWLFIVWLWGVLIYFSQWVAEMFGRVDWFERNLWSTRNGYILAGFWMVVMGFLILFGVVPVSWVSPTDINTNTAVQVSN